LSHPSFGYLKILFRSLFTSKTEPIKCETCIQAKNHRVSFPSNNSRVNYAFSTFYLLQDILTKEIIGRGIECGGLYYVSEVAHKGHVMLTHRTVTRHLWLWHRRLGHPSFGYLKILFPNLFTSNNEPIKCETCIQVKNHRVTFPSNNNRVNSAFSLVHYDVWGPAPNSHNNQFQYFLLFVDDFSRMT